MTNCICSTFIRKLGINVCVFRLLEGKGVEALKELMIGKNKYVLGHSGVGKSTLVNAFGAELGFETKNISEQSKQGQHTTTFAEMYDLSF